jgi:regulatory protein
VGHTAYIDGLKMLGRRELSEEQVRTRLARRGHEQEAVDAAVARLKAEAAIDDVRTARAIARRETAIKRRGRRRVRLEIERAGVAAETARRVIDEIFEAIDDDVMMEAVLQKRLRGRDAVADEREFRRLFRYLVSEGFEADRVLRALRARRT